MNNWNPSLLEDKFLNKSELKFWKKQFQRVVDNKVDTWDYQWAHACLVNNFLSINPQINLVKNIGFDERATHTKSAIEIYIQDACEIEFPLKHPIQLNKNIQNDVATYEMLFRTKSIPERLIAKIIKFFIKS